MSAGAYNFEVEQGTTLDHPVVWYVPDPGDPDNPDAAGATRINLTGFTARMQVRASKASPTILHEFTTENGGITITAPLTGTITIKASATITAGWTFTTGVYDLEVVSSGGIVTRLLEGTFTVDPEVTR